MSAENLLCIEHLETPSTDSSDLDCRVSPPSDLDGEVGNGRGFSLLMLPDFFSPFPFSLQLIGDMLR